MVLAFFTEKDTLFIHVIYIPYLNYNFNLLSHVHQIYF